MKKALLCGVMGAALVGCGVHTDESDEEILRRLILQSQWSQGTSPEGKADSSKAGIMGDTITPWGWYREETGHGATDVNISIVGDSAFVELLGSNLGNFHIIAYNQDSGGIVDHIKSYEDKFRIAAIFKKIGDPGEDNGWVMTDVTNINLTSSEDPRVKLDSLLIVGGTPDSVMLYSMDTLMSLDDPRWVVSSDTVKVTAFTGDTNPVMALYGFAGDTGVVSFMSQTSPGVWEAQVPVVGTTNVFYVATEVLPWEVVNTVSSPYQAQIWIVQYELR